ncbi:hypothetical protein JTE90_006153 [Oedothorax gibbosus]|uniref:Uncharacterized protein n=1 Tax=Oedothorax gibbosus TaxID=931172 RepID=A0AAV6U5U1_9ARAC|nr:hypothetical protein JTE90_006153 [Oedothorax gibbosus]
MCNKTLKVHQNSYSHLLYLFRHLAEDLKRNHNLNENDVQTAIDVMNINFRRVSKGQLPSEINFNDMNYCVGYLHRFALCHATMVQKAIVFHVLRSPPLELMVKLSPNQGLNLVGIGSGPANDVIGFLSAFKDQCTKLRSLDITVVDKMPGWNQAFTEAVRILRSDKSSGVLSTLFKSGGPDVTTSYLAGDLEMENLSQGLQTKLRSADVILLIKVLSHVPDHKKLLLLRNIETNMSPGAVLIYMDSPFPSSKFADLTSLKSVYEAERKKYKFRFRVYNFGHINLTQCHASTRIFVKQN